MILKQAVATSLATVMVTSFSAMSWQPRIMSRAAPEPIFNELTFSYSEVIPKQTDKQIYQIPRYPGFKAYMPYTSLTNKQSLQYLLQKKCITDSRGVRTVDNRYCVAVGSHFNTSIGQYLDIVLENGTKISCVMGDLKADIHTDSQHIFTKSKCCSEFIVDMAVLPDHVALVGDISYLNTEWQSPVKEIIVLNEGVEGIWKKELKS